MREKTKRKLLGNRFYAIYRRYRYLRYVRKVRRKRQREQKLEEEKEQDQFKQNVKAQRKLEKRLEKRRISEQKRKKKEEKRAVKKAIREKIKADREREKLKIKEEKERIKQEQEEVKARLNEKIKQDRKLLIEQKRKQKEQEEQRKKKRSRLRPYLIRRRLREIGYGIRNINRSTLRRWKEWFITLAETKSDRKTFFRIAINSLSLFFLSHIVIFFTGQFITVWTALSFDYESILFYYKIYYNIESSEWTGDAVKVLYSIKPIVGLILGFVCLIIYSTNQNDTGKFKMFFLWGFVHGMVLFFGSLLMGTLLNKGFGWVIAYLYYKDTGKMIFSILSIFALFVSGSAIGRMFLISGNSYFNFIDSRNRKFLIMSQVIIPVIIGSLLLSLLKIPDDLYYTTNEEVNYEVLKLWMVLLIAIPVIFSMKSYGAIFFDEEERKIRINWYFILSAVVLTALLIYGLEGGAVFSPS